MKSKLTSLMGAPMTDNVIAIRNSAAEGTEVDAIETAVEVILLGKDKRCFINLSGATSPQERGVYEWTVNAKHLEDFFNACI